MSTKTSTVTYGSDSPYSTDVKWYAGGTYYSESKTLGVSPTYVAPTYQAEFGSIVITVDGVPTSIDAEYSGATGTGAATNATDTQSFDYTGIAEGDVVVMHYIRTDGAATALTHIASCMDVKMPTSADTKSQPVQGQSNELQKVGSLKTTLTLERVQYDLTLVGMACGNLFEDDDGNTKWTSAFAGFQKIGCIMGEELDADGALVRKWIAYGATCSSLDLNEPTGDFYTEALEFTVDEIILFKVATA